MEKGQDISFESLKSHLGSFKIKSHYEVLKINSFAMLTYTPMFLALFSFYRDPKFITDVIFFCTFLAF